MNSFRTIAGAIALALTTLAPAVRAEELVSRPGSATVATATWHFVPTGRIDFARILPSPPAPGSLAQEADLWAVQQAQVWRSADQVAWAQAVARNDLFAFRAVLGPWFTRANVPKTAELLAAVDYDLNSAIAVSKRLFHRPRPFSVDPGLSPCVRRPTDGSYPSGHSMSFYTEASVLAEVVPARRAELFAFARKMAWGRVIGGVHFPTDLEGGRRAALAVMRELDANPAFRAAVEASRREVAAVAP